MEPERQQPAEQQLQRRGMKPEVKDVVYVVGEEGDDGDSSAGGTADVAMLVVENVPAIVFTENRAKEALERMFEGHGQAKFVYTKSAARVHVAYGSSVIASEAREALDEMVFEGEELAVKFTRTLEVQMDYHFLAPPKPKRLMLISPPCSPPEGWAPVPESNPLIDYELIAALAGISDSKEDIELQPETRSSPKLVLSGSCS